MRIIVVAILLKLFASTANALTQMDKSLPKPPSRAYLQKKNGWLLATRQKNFDKFYLISSELIKASNSVRSGVNELADWVLSELATFLT